MTLWQGILLGLVQGLTEFLPVSSDGHLVVAEALLGVNPPGVSFEVALHLATLVAILWVYGARLWSVARGALGGDRELRRYAALLLAGTVPAGVVGALFEEAVGRLFDSVLAAGAGFLVTGCVLWSVRTRGGDRAAPGLWGAVGIGCAQAAAILPGVSRSGCTVSAALWLRLDPERAAEFSFLLAVPAMAGAGLLEARNAAADLGTVGGVPLAAGCIVALLSGVWAIRFLVLLLRRRRFHMFAPYCWIVGVLTVAYALWRA